MKLIPDQYEKIGSTFMKILCKLLKSIYQPNISLIQCITKPPWMTPDLNRLIRKKQRLYNKAKKLKAADNWAVYNKFKCVSLFECKIINILLTLSIPQVSWMVINHFGIISSITNKIMLESAHSKPPVESTTTLVGKTDVFNNTFKSFFT